MLGFAWRSVRGRPTSSLVIVLGLLAASLSLSLLGLVGARAQIELVGDIERAWRTPYDILVRPAGTTTALEASEGLVRPNFVSGLRGGISQSQLSTIRSDPDVEVAAPIAMAGFVNWPLALLLPLDGATSGDQVRVYRITTSITGDAGLSTYPVEQRMVVSASTGRYDVAGRQLTIGDISLGCPVGIDCFAGAACRDSECEAGGFPSSRDARYYLPLLIPVAIAGVDPAAEAQLAGLDGCVSSGRYLTDKDQPVGVGDPEEQLESIPVLLSTRSFIDQQIDVKIEQATLPAAGLDLREIDDQAWTSSDEDRYAVQDLYREYIPSVHDYIDPWPVWSTSDVAYLQVGARTLQPRTIDGTDPFATSPLSSEYGIPDGLLTPPEAADPGFREVSVHRDGYRPGPGSAFRWKLWNVVGQYDPQCLPGFDPLAGGALETYSFPAVTTPDGRALTPSRSLTGYVTPPPLLLTTLAGAAWLSDPQRYRDQAGEAYISAVRLRIRNVGPASAGAYARLLAIATRLSERTHLQVDVVKGGSPTAVQVELPAGKFGRPALTVTEGWSLKGAAVRVSEAVSEQDLAITLVSLMLGLLLAYATWASAFASRAGEFQTLLDLGWPRSSLRRSILAEHILLGAAAGVVGAMVSAASGILLGAANTGMLAITAGLLPLATVTGAALLSGRSNRIDAVRPRSARPTIRSLSGFALAQVASQPIPAALMALGIALAGAAAGSTLLIALAFHGRLDATALGAQISLVAGWFEWLVCIVAITCAGVAVLQIQHLLLLGQRRPLATLLAIGWPASWVRRYLLVQAGYLGAAGGGVAGTCVIVLAGAAGDLAAGLLAGIGLVVASTGFAIAIARPVVATLDGRRLADNLREES